MNKSQGSGLRRWMCAPALSPAGFVVRALLIAVGFALCHLLGWREHTTFLTGTPAAADTSVRTSAVLGTIYMATYFGAVLGTPILLLSAGILAVWQRVFAAARGEA